ncbi:MAG: Vitamin B12 dependent methionine synthase activation subunit [Clostridia bacterium]|nr:Vitamin B12 dependent methionine synthase activation subunit [Clostridia bacterium]
MSFTVHSRFFEPPAVSQKEILRYAGCKGAERKLLGLVEECMREVENKLSYRVCYCRLPVSIQESQVDFGAFSCCSSSLAKNLSGCNEAVLFAATVGIELDRMIERYSRLSPAKAVIFDAIGAERIESLCDVFCHSFAEEENALAIPRFSPGYGDLPLADQKNIFAVLGCEKRIGLVLNDSLLMSPSKSVTAIVGLKEKNKE